MMFRTLVVSPVRENVSSPVADPSMAATGRVAATDTEDSVALDKLVKERAAARQDTDREARRLATGLFMPASIPGRRRRL